MVVMAKAIIFDFYGVFYTDPYSAWLTANNLKREGQYYTAAYLQDTGQITGKEFLTRLSELTGRQVTHDELHAATRIDPGTVKIARELHGRHKIALLSNASAESLNKLLGEYNLTDIFDQVVISSDVGMAKPDPRIFEYTLEKLGVSASEAVFIDDNEAYVKAAEGLGIKGIQFKSSEQLTDDLVNLDAY